ncbi:MAG: exostosin family protein [Aphanizomenon gracile PMC644.10]|nr:exostosin family protein [Aphanizomenon gracile PMC644.10]
MQAIKVYISSCEAGESFYGTELKRLADLSPSYITQFVDKPDDADIILVVDISNNNLFENLRKNPVWKKHPNKSFGIYEGDCAPTFLHGLYSDARKSPFNFNRFLGLDYHMHQICFQNPVPDYINVRNCEKSLLYSFAGRMSHKLRKKLLSSSYPEQEVKLINTSSYNHFEQNGEFRQEFQQTYWSLCQQSKYVLCPKGSAASSVRLFEMMEAGIAPVIISDDWIPPYGPNWQDFALIVPEKNIHSLYSIVKSHEDEWQIRGQQARLAWEKHFTSGKYWEFCLSSIDKLISQKMIAEKIFEKSYPSILVSQKLRLILVKLLLQSKLFYNKCITLTK